VDKQNGDGTAALEKALDVLDAIGSSAEGMNQVALSEQLAIPRTTLYRLLATLTARGLVRRDSHKRVYRLGLKCFELARTVQTSPDLVAAAAVEIRALRDLTGETTYLGALDGAEVLAIERMDGAHSHRSQSALGQRKPLHCTSQGKAMLSVLSQAERDELLRGLTLKAITPHSIIEKKRLNAELNISRSRGWSIDDEEMILGVRCVGAPIIDAHGRVRGAISVAGPAYRMTIARLQGLGPEVAEAARRIGAQLVNVTKENPASSAQAVDGQWAFNGQFPRWSVRHQALFWADTLAPTIHLMQEGCDRELVKMDAPILGLVVWGNRLVVTGAMGWHLIELEDFTRPRISELFHWSGAPLRAICTDAVGGVWGCEVGFTDAAASLAQSSVGRWTPGGELDTVWQVNEDISALAWNATGQQLYGLAQKSGTIFVFESGRRTPRRLASVPKGSGKLSGLCVDAQGGVWTTLQDGWSALRFTADGTQDRVIGLPVPCPTDLAVGDLRTGRDPNSSTRTAMHQTLFLTSARQSVSVEALNSAPLSGRLFSCGEV
jgi:IclR family transcriptional regulator, acetate operon repressor